MAGAQGYTSKGVFLCAWEGMFFMASGQTEHYGLSQWESGDAFLREEFNGDFQRIDEGLEEGRVVTGTYMGTMNPNSGQGGPQEITLGFRPRAVLAMANKSNFSNNLTCRVALVLDGADNSYLTITDTGFLAHSAMNLMDGGETYYPPNPYRYVAWR